MNMSWKFTPKLSNMQFFVTYVACPLITHNNSQARSWVLTRLLQAFSRLTLMTLMDCLISSSFLALSLINCFSSDLFLPRLLCKEKIRIVAYWNRYWNSFIPWKSHEGPCSCQRDRHLVILKQDIESKPFFFKSSPSSSSTRGQWRQCRGTCAWPRRRPCRYRSGLCGSRPPEDVRASCRSSPPGGKWVRSDDETSKTSPGN